uniref:Uncharacterized protein n=1 Tax=Capra hircus TaxID=9925 RepID=A0A8C2SMB8_CAPHI
MGGLPGKLRGRRGCTPPALQVRPCGGAHTCIHIVGPTAGLAAASCRGAACARIEDVVNRALHLTVIDGLGALGGAGEGGEGSASVGMEAALSAWSTHPRPVPAPLCLGSKVTPPGERPSPVPTGSTFLAEPWPGLSLCP